MNKAKEISALWSEIKPQIGELVRLCHEVESHYEVTADAYQRGYEEGYKDGYNEPGKGKIQVGDEVKCIRAGWTAIVTKIKEDGYLTLMGNDGAIANGYDEKDFIKTGRHFPEIAEVLRKMKENSDG